MYVWQPYFPKTIKELRAMSKELTTGQEIAEMKGDELQAKLEALKATTPHVINQLETKLKELEASKMNESTAGQVVERPPVYFEQIESTRRAINASKEMTIQIAEALKPILRSIPESDSSKEPEPPPHESDLGNNLQNLRIHAESLNRALTILFDSIVM